MVLHENAFRKLKPGEKYEPYVPENKGWRQISPYSLIFGFLALIAFTGASVFLGVKIAQVPEAGMSVCLLAMVLTILLKRKGAILENVIVQCIAATATGVACLIFVMPATYILGLPNPTFWQMFVPTTIGTILAILFTVLVRNYYVAVTHGLYPFPEATAAAKTLVAAESTTGKEVRLIGLGLLFGGIIDLLNNYFGLWKSTFSTALLPVLEKVASKAKLVFSYETSAAVFGMGYIIGLRYALIICATSLVAYWVLVPFFANCYDLPWLAQFIPSTILLNKSGGIVNFRELEAGDIFMALVRPIGIGTFFTAGLISIIYEGRTIVNSIRGIFGKIGLAGGEMKENARDLSGLWMLGLFILIIVALLGFLLHLFHFAWGTSVIILLATLLLLAVFIPAAIMATATTGNAPVSGMTIVCLVICCLLLQALGFGGEGGKMTAVLLGTFLCVTLAFGSSFITDLKIGYWLGSTPAKQQGMKIAATIVSVVVAIFSLYIVAKQYGFVQTSEHPNPMPAPQANAMAGIIGAFMSGGEVAWYLYALGAFIALAMKLVFKIPPIVVALGLYIPIEYNTPILAGALVAHFLSQKKKGEGEEAAGKRYNNGTMLATGLVAAGSIAGILSALLKYFELDFSTFVFVRYLNYPAINPAGEKLSYSLATECDWTNWISLLVLATMIVFLYKMSKKE